MRDEDLRERLKQADVAVMDAEKALADFYFSWLLARHTLRKPAAFYRERLRASLVSSGRTLFVKPDKMFFMERLLRKARRAPSQAEYERSREEEERLWAVHKQAFLQRARIEGTADFLAELFWRELRTAADPSSPLALTSAERALLTRFREKVASVLRERIENLERLRRGDPPKGTDTNGAT